MMPFYTCFAFSDSLSAAQKANIAEEITRIHTKLTGAPRSFVRVLFHEMQSSDIFTGGKAPAMRDDPWCDPGRAISGSEKATLI